MMSAGETSRRLTRGPALSFLARSSLWMKADHLLSVEGTGFSENYRRFYFDDIQALIVCQTERRFHIGIALGVLVAIGLAVLAASGSFGGKMFGGSFAGLFGILMVVNLLKGPGCTCHLRTSVSLTQLKAVKRLNKIEQILPEIRARIADVQGEREPAETLEAMMPREPERPASAAVYESPKAIHHGTRFGRAKTAKPYAGAFHLWLFSLLLADAGLALLAFAGSHPLMAGLRVMVVMGAVFCGMAALVKHEKRRLPFSLRAPAVAGTVYLVAGAIALYVFFVLIQVQEPETAGDTMRPLRVLAASSPYDGIWPLVLFLANAGLSGVLGAFGLLQIMDFRARKRSAAAQPPPLPTP